MNYDFRLLSFRTDCHTAMSCASSGFIIVSTTGLVHSFPHLLIFPGSPFLGTFPGSAYQMSFPLIKVLAALFTSPLEESPSASSKVTQLLISCVFSLVGCRPHESEVHACLTHHRVICTPGTTWGTTDARLAFVAG